MASDYTMIVGDATSFVFQGRGDETGTTPPTVVQGWIIAVIIPSLGRYFTTIIAQDGTENGWSVSGYTPPTYSEDPENTVYPGGSVTVTSPDDFDADFSLVYGLAYLNNDSDKYDAVTWNFITSPDNPPAPPVIQPQGPLNPVVNPNPPPAILPGGCTGCNQIINWNDVMADSYSIGYDGVIKESGITNTYYTLSNLTIGRAYQVFVLALREGFDPVMSNIVEITPCIARGTIEIPGTITGTTDCLCD